MPTVAALQRPGPGWSLKIAVIDNAARRYLNSFCFGVRVGASHRWPWVFLLAASLLFGCSPRSAPDGKREESFTAGRIQVVCAPEAYRLVEQEGAEFRALYPGATLEIAAAPSRGAIAGLFAARADLAVVTRELEPEEREAAVRGGLELGIYVFARDAVVVVVHPDNPVENLGLDDLRRIYLGEVRRWSQLGGDDAPVEPVVQSPDSDIYEYMMQKVMGGQAVVAPSITAASDSEVVRLVARSPQAIGYVSLGSVTDAVRPLRLATLVGLRYWKPDLEAVYRGEYPLTRYFYMCAREKGPRLVDGFITFVTSRDGQRIVRDAGLVPTTVPVRFVRRGPLMGSH
jgi:phosphate transport system substrate-binding protein